MKKNKSTPSFPPQGTPQTRSQSNIHSDDQFSSEKTIPPQNDSKSKLKSTQEPPPVFFINLNMEDKQHKKVFKPNPPKQLQSLMNLPSRFSPQETPIKEKKDPNEEEKQQIQSQNFFQGKSMKSFAQDQVQEQNQQVKTTASHLSQSTEQDVEDQEIEINDSHSHMEENILLKEFMEKQEKKKNKQNKLETQTNRTTTEATQIISNDSIKEWINTFKGDEPQIRDFALLYFLEQKNLEVSEKNIKIWKSSVNHRMSNFFNYWNSKDPEKKVNKRNAKIKEKQEILNFSQKRMNKKQEGPTPNLDHELVSAQLYFQEMIKQRILKELKENLLSERKDYYEQFNLSEDERNEHEVLFNDLLSQNPEEDIFFNLYRAQRQFFDSQNSERKNQNANSQVANLNEQNDIQIQERNELADGGEQEIVFPALVPTIMVKLSKEIDKYNVIPAQERPRDSHGEDLSSLAQKKKQIDHDYKEAINACKVIQDKVSTVILNSMSALENEQKELQEEVKEKYEEKKRKLAKEIDICDVVFK